MPAMGFWTYILRLRGGRRYVGFSSRPKSRIRSHFRGKGASFTKRWRPAGVISVFRHKTKSKAKRAERSAYRSTSRRFGRSRVRGAGHTRRW
ncbi:MAG: catalytic domain [Thermoplasmata archaeon]|nr:catalytic domain [Thermoplasmata archaeon]